MKIRQIAVLVPAGDAGLFDQALAPVWESGLTPANSVRLPPEVAGRLRAGSYFWMVTATLAGGQEVPSRLEEFTLRE